MKEFLLHRELLLNRPLAEIFKFFADPQNLETLTPPWLKFEVTTPSPMEMRTGLLIDYKLRVHGFPIRWRSEILSWNPPHSFVDNQIKGPYTLWHHTHRFEETSTGTMCYDDVRYRPPGGTLVNKLFVRPDIEKIFNYRRQKLLELFPI